MLGSMAHATERIGLVTGVTCPAFRYHPAIIAQAAATVQILSDGRFTLGVGSGERLSEHIIGREFPGVHKRQAVFREALEIIKLLWQGGYQNYDGRFLQLEDARIFDLPDQLPVMAVAAGCPAAARIGAEIGDGLFATEPKSELTEAYASAGGSGPKFAEVPLAWAPDEDTAAQAVLETTRWALTGWKVMSELPNPVNFEAASATVRPDDIREQMVTGPDPQRYREGIEEYEKAGYDHIVLMNCGPDPDGFLDFVAKEIRPAC